MVARITGQEEGRNQDIEQKATGYGVTAHEFISLAFCFNPSSLCLA